MNWLKRLKMKDELPAKFPKPHNLTNCRILTNTDKDSQLLEAVTRTLATGLIPCYEDEAEDWVNADEACHMSLILLSVPCLWC
ncbi:hypothetical protein HPB50_024854 [Hyalomma asiaticum]|uniref:Uncharacterized protein n=1 Tax=Hyalomma asiaticum TaxID=266040 RepID=A0ACB7S9V6_HYAAI|nr:hypothetical protein HPB50_024854 [Hyalomma asiaticum]